MAKLSSDKKYVTVEWGDTLSAIARDYAKYSNNATYKQLGYINQIPNLDLIYVGQKIYLTSSGSGSSSGGSNSKTTKNTKTRITEFGLSAASTSSNTLFAVWTCYRDMDQVKAFAYEWEYTVGDMAGGSEVWYKGSNQKESDKEQFYSTYQIPTGAEKIRFRVKAVSDVKSKDEKTGKETLWFTDAEWSDRGFTDETKVYYAGNTPPPVPDKINAEIDHETMKLKVEISDYPIDDLIEDGSSSKTTVAIQVIANDKEEYAHDANFKFNDYGYLTKEFSVTEGNRYKVRCRAMRNGFKSAWSSYTSNVSSVPITPIIGSIKPTKNTATNKVDIYLEWSSSKTAEKYTIQYAAVRPGESPKFDASNDESIKSIETSDDTTHYTLVNVDTGLVYYFRIAAKIGEITSKWSEPSEPLVIGTPPGAPTTWSSATSVSIGDPLYLYWVHNPTDGSSETSANIQIEMWRKNPDDTEVLLYTIDTVQFKSTEYEDQYTTSFCDFNKLLDTYPLAETYLGDGVKLRWRVRTAGVTGDYGNDVTKHWSDSREVDVHAPPELTFTVQPNNDIAYKTDFVCTSLPLSIYAFAGPSTQIPRSYYISITSNDIYETVDNIGNNKIVGSGELIYSKYIDNKTIVDEMISAGDVSLVNGVSYKIECVVSMDSGLTTSHSMNFSVNWNEDSYEPSAQVTFNPDTLVANIRPYCEEITISYYRVDRSGTKYLSTAEPVAISYGMPATTSRGKAIYTTTGERVYSGIVVDENGNFSDDEIYYYEVRTGLLVDGITLSVYRREYDGRFTEIATGIDNTKNTYVTDPHPALDYARYRIVAMENATGAVSYTDLPGVPIGETGIILQWAEEWSSFDVNPDIVDGLSKPNWAGSLLRLPYNVDVSPSYGIDTTLIEYAGRQHPVSYYGTQLGESATWSTVIPKSDKETIYALHRLAKWAGNVYAREPSGMGYWANVTVQFPQKHLDQTVPVSLTLTRVEGGM